MDKGDRPARESSDRPSHVRSRKAKRLRLRLRIPAADGPSNDGRVARTGDTTGERSSATTSVEQCKQLVACDAPGLAGVSEGHGRDSALSLL